MWVWSANFASVALVSAAVAIELSVSRFPTGLLVLPVLAPVAYAAGRMAWRVRSANVTIDSAGVLVAGPWRTVRVPLEDATEFRALVVPGKNGQPTIELVRRHGHPIRLWIFNRDGFVWQMQRLAENLQPDAKALNHALSEARHC